MGLLQYDMLAIDGTYTVWIIPLFVEGVCYYKPLLTRLGDFEVFVFQNVVYCSTGVRYYLRYSCNS